MRNAHVYPRFLASEEEEAKRPVVKYGGRHRINLGVYVREGPRRVHGNPPRSGADGVFARNDQGNYDAPATTVRRASVNVDGLPHMSGNHLDNMSQTHREIVVDQFVEEWKGASIAARRGIRVNTSCTHSAAAFNTLRHSITTVAALSTEIDLPH